MNIYSDSRNVSGGSLSIVFNFASLHTPSILFCKHFQYLNPCLQCNLVNFICKDMYVSLLNLCSYFKIILLFSEQSFSSLNLISHFITHLSQHIHYKSSSLITPLSIQFYQLLQSSHSFIVITHFYYTLK